MNTYWLVRSPSPFAQKALPARPVAVAALVSGYVAFAPALIAAVYAAARIMDGVRWRFASGARTRTCAGSAR